jgi:hypothetical protein
MVTGVVTSAALGAGLLMGGVVPGFADHVPAGVTVDRPDPKERPTPGTRPDPRCDRAEQGLAIAKANVTKAKQRLKAAPRKKKPARRAQLKTAKQSRAVAKARVEAFC